MKKTLSIVRGVVCAAIGIVLAIPMLLGFLLAVFLIDLINGNLTMEGRKEAIDYKSDSFFN